MPDRLARVLSWFQPYGQRGQGLAEYALILALIAIIAIVALLFLGGKVSQILSSVGKSV
jgi:Flp pilus assembly pilin Flp